MSTLTQPDYPNINQLNSHSKLTAKDIDDFCQELKGYLSDVRPQRSELMAILCAFKKLIISLMPEPSTGGGSTGGGDVYGPDISTNNNLCSFDGVTGKIIKDSGWDISDFAAATHYHDDRYYTDDEIDLMLDGFISEETDPIFVNSEAYSISAGDKSNWNDGYNAAQILAANILTCSFITADGMQVNVVNGMITEIFAI